MKIIQYRVRWGEITPVEVKKTNALYFDTYAQARNFIIAQARKAVNWSKSDLAKARVKFNKAMNLPLTEPEELN